MSGQEQNQKDDKALKLNGDKITLGVRPLNKLSTASSRSSLLREKCFSRPVSALPLLFNTNNDRNSNLQISKRPFSADCKNYIYSTHLRINNTDTSMDSIDSIPDESMNLTSSSLYQTFLSEPILTPGIASKPPLPPNKLIKIESKNTLPSLPDPIHDYLTLKYEVDGNKSIREDKGSDDSSLKSIHLDDTNGNNDENKEKIIQNDVKVQNWFETKEDNIKIPDLSQLDLDKLFADEHDEKFDSFFRNLGEKEVKTTQTENKTKSSVKKMRNKKNKVKFIAFPMKICDDYEESSARNKEVQTWMSNDEKKVIPKETKKVFDDFLENFDDLLIENSSLLASNDNLLSEIPQRDDNNKSSTSGSFDDIVSILQVLEQEDKKAQDKMESIKKIIDEEILLSPRTSASSKTAPPKRSDGKCASSSLPTASSSLSSSSSSSRQSQNDKNYRELLMFLDEVDRSCSKCLGDEKSTSQIAGGSLKVTKLNLDTVPKTEDLMTFSKENLASYIIDVSLRLKEKSSSICLLQNEISSLREELTSQTKRSEKSWRQKLKQQKDEYERAVMRHQKFIDQLINDKKVLNQQCENLVRDLKSLEDRYQSNLKALEHKHQVEMHKCKEMNSASEKIKRERWIDSKTQKIKELTVKSIEPELKSMEKRQLQEISELRQLHAKEIEDLEIKSSRRMHEQCESIRVQMTEEREKALVHEREVLRLRYDSLMQNEEKTYHDLKKRLMQEHANQTAEFEQRQLVLQSEKDKAIKSARIDFEDRLQNVMRHHENELKMLKETTQLELETWQNNVIKTKMAELSKLEEKIRSKCQKERDREIEKVIERLEQEASDTKSQIESSTENRIQRLKSKYEKEIKDLEVMEKETELKYKEVKKRLIHAEDLIMTYRGTIEQLEQKICENNTFLARFESERDEIRNVIKKEMANDLKNLEDELRNVKDSRDKEIQQLYSRVRISVTRKDELIDELTKERKSLQEKCFYLENMLEQQRKDYLIK